MSKKTGARRKDIRRCAERVAKAVKGAGWRVVRMGQSVTTNTWYVVAWRRRAYVDENGKVGRDYIKIRISDHEQLTIQRADFKLKSVCDLSILVQPEEMNDMEELQSIVTMGSAELTKRKRELEFKSLMSAK